MLIKKKKNKRGVKFWFPPSLVAPNPGKVGQHSADFRDHRKRVVLKDCQVAASYPLYNPLSIREALFLSSVFFPTGKKSS
jgi:hypothetical protein